MMLTAAAGQQQLQLLQKLRVHLQAAVAMLAAGAVGVAERILLQRQLGWQATAASCVRAWEAAVVLPQMSLSFQSSACSSSSSSSSSRRLHLLQQQQVRQLFQPTVLLLLVSWVIVYMLAGQAALVIAAAVH
jgi:hypothetical protein